MNCDMLVFKILSCSLFPNAIEEDKDEIVNLFNEFVHVAEANDNTMPYELFKKYEHKFNGIKSMERQTYSSDGFRNDKFVRFVPATGETLVYISIWFREPWASED